LDDIATQDAIHLKARDSRAWVKGIGLQGEIINTRGHSDDSISIVLDAGLAFTGDLQPASMQEGDTTRLAQQSWELLRKLGVQTIHPGHGPVRPIP
jgi:ribonuclease/clavin/mitogillin